MPISTLESCIQTYQGPSIMRNKIRTMSLVVVIFLDRLWFRFDFGVLSQMLFGAMCSRLRCLSWSARVGAGAGKCPKLQRPPQSALHCVTNKNSLQFPKNVADVQSLRFNLHHLRKTIESMVEKKPHKSSSTLTVSRVVSNIQGETSFSRIVQILLTEGVKILYVNTV